MHSKRKRVLWFGFAIAVVLLFAGLTGGIGSLFFTDETSGSVFQLDFFGIIPTKGSFALRAPNFKPSKSKWRFGAETSFRAPIVAGDIVAVAYGTNRLGFRLRSVDLIGSTIVIETLNTNGEWQSSRCLDDTILLADAQLTWSVAAQDRIYLWADQHPFRGSNEVLRVVYPLREATFREFLSGSRGISNWFVYPYDADERVVESLRTALHSNPKSAISP